MGSFGDFQVKGLFFFGDCQVCPSATRLLLMFNIFSTFFRGCKAGSRQDVNWKCMVQPCYWQTCPVGGKHVACASGDSVKVLFFWIQMIVWDTKEPDKHNSQLPTQSQTAVWNLFWVPVYHFFFGNKNLSAKWFGARWFGLLIENPQVWSVVLLALIIFLLLGTVGTVSFKLRSISSTKEPNDWRL